MTKEELLCRMFDYIGGGGPVSGIWPPFLPWLEEMGYTQGEIDRVLREAHNAAHITYDGLE